MRCRSVHGVGPGEPSETASPNHSPRVDYWIICSPQRKEAQNEILERKSLILSREIGLKKNLTEAHMNPMIQTNFHRARIRTIGFPEAGPASWGVAGCGSREDESR